jgi:hypothetical protein
MKMNELIQLCLEVLKDTRVIGATIVCIFFMLLANYVVNYRKKPPRNKKAKEVKPVKASSENNEEKNRGEATAAEGMN